jgi:hypothetical protein
LFDGAEHVFNARPRFGDPLVAPFLARGEWTVALPLALDQVPPVCLSFASRSTLV